MIFPQAQAQPCPSCGHCPTCGRGRNISYPVYPQPWYGQPVWVSPQRVWFSNGNLQQNLTNHTTT